MKEGRREGHWVYTCCYCDYRTRRKAELVALDGPGRIADISRACVDVDACSERMAAQKLTPRNELRRFDALGTLERVLRAGSIGWSVEEVA